MAQAAPRFPAGTPEAGAPLMQLLLAVSPRRPGGRVRLALFDPGLLLGLAVRAAAANDEQASGHENEESGGKAAGDEAEPAHRTTSASKRRMARAARAAPVMTTPSWMRF